MTSSDTKPSTLQSVVIGIALLGFLVVLVLPHFGHPPEPTRMLACKTNLRQITIAMHDYHSKYSTFPPAFIADAEGHPMHSWRVLLLPFLEQEELYKQYRFDEPWNGPHNRLLADKLQRVFRCPSDLSSPATDTNYVVVVGQKTVFPGTESVAIKEITDGLAWTILVVEVANSGIHWMEPRDLSYDDAIKGINRTDGLSISSGHGDGAQVLRVEGTVRFVTNKVPLETLRRLLERNDSETIPDNY